jgi:hypothetical protein
VELSSWCSMPFHLQRYMEEVFWQPIKEVRLNSGSSRLCNPLERESRKLSKSGGSKCVLGKRNGNRWNFRRGRRESVGPLACG